MNKYVLQKRNFLIFNISTPRNPSYSTVSDLNSPFNEFGIQTLPLFLHKWLFPTNSPPSSKANLAESSEKKLELNEIAKNHLRKHNIPFDTTKPEALKIPDGLEKILNSLAPKLFYGKNLTEHMHAVGEWASGDSEKLLDGFQQEICKYLIAKDKAFELSLVEPSKWWNIPTPTRWAVKPGWTKYTLINAQELHFEESNVPFPDAQVIVFDVETAPGLEEEGQRSDDRTPMRQMPVLAVARSSNHWYSWCSAVLFMDSSASIVENAKTISPVRLVPLGWPDKGEGARIVIGHNVSFDRARVLEEYNQHQLMPQPKPKKGFDRLYLDTLSLHCAVAGISNQQRSEWKSWFKKNNNPNVSTDAYVTNEDDQNPETFPTDNYSDGLPDEHIDDKLDSANNDEDTWYSKGSTNALKEAVKLHCNPGDPMLQQFLHDKQGDLKHLLSLKTLADIKASAQTCLLEYCSRDVAATLALLQATWPKWSKSAHPVTRAAFFEMGSKMALPVKHKTWSEYLRRACEGYQNANQEVDRRLQALVASYIEVDEASADGKPPEEHFRKFKEDPWLKHLDWSLYPERWSKARFLKDGTTFAKNGEPRLLSNPLYSGKPMWYKALISEGAVKITTKTRILPYLLKLRWCGAPVHFIAKAGWCYQEDSQSSETDNKDVVKCETTGSLFRRIPHAERSGLNVGCLLCKAFLPAIEQGKLQADNREGQDLLNHLTKTAATWAFWTGYSERIRNQMIVWQGEPGTRLATQIDEVDTGKKKGHAKHVDEKKQFSSDHWGLIIPSIIPMGTVTRRAVEATWMTATNAKPNLAASELKSRITAPPGYCFVGADVDAQEIWIAGLCGDAQFGAPGATALAWMTLQGTKAAGTDLHSRTASLLGLSSRDAAKVFNYGRVYGAGVSYAAELLLRFNPNMREEEALEKARALYKATKGRQTAIRQTKQHADETTQACQDQAKKDPLQEGISYSGGSESFMFNFIEAVAQSKHSLTPFLQAPISQALAQEHVGTGYMTSRVNWVVQSSGVDYLHLLLVLTRWLMSALCTKALKPDDADAKKEYKEEGIPARLLLTIHDEVRFLVKETHKLRACFALQLANLFTRAFFAHRLGINDLPWGVAFFSGVDIDTVLRKDPQQPIITPTTPKDQTVPPGRVLDIHQLMQELPGELAGAELTVKSDIYRHIQRTYVKTQNHSVFNPFAFLEDNFELKKRHLLAQVNWDCARRSSYNSIKSKTKQTTAKSTENVILVNNQNPTEAKRSASLVERVVGSK